MGKRLEEVDAHYKLQGLSKNCLHSSASCDPNFYRIYKPFFLLFFNGYRHNPMLLVIE